MKCPHCNQEHEDGKKFCPNTGEKIISPLVSCPNTDCVNYGRNVLPCNYQFCDECGTPLNHDIEAGIVKNVDWKKLFPVDKVWLGVTNIFEIEPDPDLGIGAHCGKNGYWLIKKIGDSNIGYNQKYVHDFVTRIYYAHKLPKKWEKLLGFNCGACYDQVIKSIDGKGNILKECINVENEKEIRFITNDKQYILYFRFTKDSERLDFVGVDSYCCPYCGSFEVEMIEGSYNCKNCNFKWGNVCECPRCDSENIEYSETHFLCKDCGYEINL